MAQVKWNKVSVIKSGYRDFVMTRRTGNAKQNEGSAQASLVGAARLRARDLAGQGINGYRLRRRLPEKDLWHYAEICRVQKVMIPYREAMQ
jgi:hypothetical protein